MWLRTLLLIILILLVMRAVSRLMRGVMQGASGQGGPRRSTQPAPVKMVADPVCGTFVTPRDSLSLAARGATHYFCSDRCREQFRKSA